MRSQQWLVAVLYFSKWFILLDQVLELDAYIEHSHDLKIACFRIREAQCPSTVDKVDNLFIISLWEIQLLRNSAAATRKSSAASVGMTRTQPPLYGQTILIQTELPSTGFKVFLQWSQKDCLGLGGHRHVRWVPPALQGPGGGWWGIFGNLSWSKYPGSWLLSLTKV